MENIYYVYILANYTNTVLYIGVTNDLMRRVDEHRQKRIAGFSQRYNVTKLVYFEDTIDIRSAIAREKQIKRWRRGKKNRLINSINPEWEDLSVKLWGVETV